MTQVSCSDRHVIAVANGNELFAWGRNHDGCLGIHAANGEAVPNPQKVDVVISAKSIKSITAGHKCSGLVAINGDLHVCGKNGGRFARNLDQLITEEFTTMHKQTDQAVFGRDFALILTLSNEITILANNKTKELRIAEKICKVIASDDSVVLQTDRGDIMHLRLMGECKPIKVGTFSDVISVAIHKDHAFVAHN